MTAATTALDALDALAALEPPMCDHYGDATPPDECSTHTAVWFGRASCGHDRLLCDGHRALFALLLTHGAPLVCAQCDAPVATISWVKL